MKKFTLIALTLLTAALLMMPAVAHASQASPPPCPDFFFQNPLQQGDWTTIAAADATNAWAATLGGSILKSSDAGQTWGFQWSPAQYMADPPPLRGLSVVNKNVVWVIGDGGNVVLTTDGGATWASRPIGDDVILYGSLRSSTPSATCRGSARPAARSGPRASTVGAPGSRPHTTTSWPTAT